MGMRGKDTVDESSPWSALPRRWVHIQLPGYRQLPEHHTYESSRFADLPPIPIRLDDDCEWLRSYGRVHAHGGLNQYERDIQPSLVEQLAQHARLELPRSFRLFMTDPDLQSRVRSCTDCYLYPGERIVETTGAIPGHLVHFLSDSQSIAHWYLHIIRSGEVAVLESSDLYGLDIESSDWILNAASRLERIDIEGLAFVYCAPTFPDFLYRFWIENEIWFALTRKGSSSLTELELEYVQHYASRGPLDLKVPD
jgi:hypothetical protein